MTENLLYIIIFSIASFVFWSFLLRRDGRHIVLSVDNIFVMCFQAIFCVVFPIVYSLTERGMNTENYTEVLLSYSFSEIAYYYFLVNVFLLVFLFVFRYKKSASYYTPKNIIHSASLNISSDIILVLGSFLLFIGIVASFLFYKAYGGYFGYLPHATVVRAGVVVVNNPFTFLSPFKGCISTSCCLFFACFVVSKKNRIVSIPLFFVSLVLSIMILYANRGRLAFVKFFVSLLLIFFFTKNKNYKLKLSTLFFVAFLIMFAIVGFEMVGQRMGRVSGTTFASGLCYELSFPFVSFKLNLSNLNFDSYHYFKDIFALPLYYLPTSIWKPVLGSTASELNTFFLTGAAKNTSGELPIDLISFSYMQGGAFGVVLVALLAGLLFRLFFSSIKKSKSLVFKSFLFVTILLNYLVNNIYYADTKDIAQRSIVLILCLIGYLLLVPLFQKKRYKKSICRTI